MMANKIHDNQRIAKNTLLLSFRMVVLMFVSLYTSRVVLDQLGVVDFGIYNVVGGVVMMLSFLNSSMTTAVQRFFSYAIGESDNNKLNKYFCISITAHFCISIIVIALAELLGVWYIDNYLNIPSDRLCAANWVLQFSVLSIVFVVMQIPYNSMIIAKEHMGIYAYISILDAALKLGIAYVLTIISWDKLQIYAVLMAVIPLVILIIYHICCRRQFEQETRFRKVKDLSAFREIIGFASWNVFGDISWTLTDQGVNLLINFFYGPAINTARAIGVQVNSAVNKFVQSFQMAVNPQIIKLYAVGDVDAMKMLVFQSSRFSYYLLFVLSLPLLFVMDDILALWLKVPPYKADIFCRLFLICTLIQIIPNLLAQIARAYGHLKKYSTIVASAIFMVFPLSFIALLLGASPETTVVVAFIVQTVLIFVRMYLIKGMIGMKYMEFIKEVLIPIIKVTCLALIFPLAMLIILSDSTGAKILLFLASFFSSLLVSYVVGLTSSEKKYFINCVTKVIKNKK